MQILFIATVIAINLLPSPAVAARETVIERDGEYITVSYEKYIELRAAPFGESARRARMLNWSIQDAPTIIPTYPSKPKTRLAPLTIRTSSEPSHD